MGLNDNPSIWKRKMRIISATRARYNDRNILDARVWTITIGLCIIGYMGVK